MVSPKPDMVLQKPDMVSQKPDMVLQKPDMAKGKAVTNEYTNLPSELPKRLQISVEEVGRRSDQITMRSIIRQLCKWHPLSAEELSGLLHRNSRYLKASYLQPMLRDGEIAHTIPDAPRHPNQRYRTVEDDSA